MDTSFRFNYRVYDSKNLLPIRPNGNLVHRVRSAGPDTTSNFAEFVQDTDLYDSQGLLHADIDTLIGGYNVANLDAVGFQGQSGSYTDIETIHRAAGLFTALSGPGAIYYDPLTAVGMARRRADALNTFDQLLHPFDGWTFGAYAYEAGQFGIGEAKGAVNMAAGSIVGVSPALTLADDMTGSRLSHPLSSVGESQADGEATFPWVVAAASGVEALAAAPRAAEGLAGVPRGPNCFVAGTPVQMADGTTRPIEKVQVGDWVKSRNPQTGKVEAKRVDRVYVRVAPQVLTLTFTDAAAHQTEAFTCTPEHPFLVDGKGFVKAEDLGIGTSLVTRAGPALTLSAVARGTGLTAGDKPGVKAGGFLVYNLRVEDDHSYFVGTLHGGTCVHNADYPVNFEMDLLPGQFGRSDKFHFNRANASLEQALKSDPALLDRLSTVSGKSKGSILARVSQTGGRKNPEGFTWQHATREQAGGREGVMQLVLKQHHIDYGGAGGVYHPLGYGGYEQWARPRGAPQR